MPKLIQVSKLLALVGSTDVWPAAGLPAAGLRLYGQLQDYGCMASYRINPGAGHTSVAPTRAKSFAP